MIIDNLLYKDEVYAIVGAVMDVHKELGSGFLESVYEEAYKTELRNQNIPFQSQVRPPVYYKGQPLYNEFIADYICNSQ